MTTKKIKKYNLAQLRKAQVKMHPIFKKRRVRKASVFGSFARGEAHKGSDIDVLVEVQRGTTLFDMVRMKLDLEKVLGRPVDLLTYKSLHPLLKKRVLSEHIAIYKKTQYESGEKLL